MSQKDYLRDISEIKTLMNKSSKFISLSGLSGILAGVYALIGAGYFYFSTSDILLSNLNESDIKKALIVFIIISLFSTITTIFFTSKRAQTINENSWDEKTKNLIQSFLTPLIIGLLFVSILFLKNEHSYLLSLILVFYGIALVNAGLRTSNLVKPLGYIQVISGLICAIYYDYSFWFFLLGFGVVHIIYGSIIYFKYDKK